MTKKKLMDHGTTRRYEDGVTQMITTLHLEVVITSNTAALHPLLVRTADLEDVDMIMICVDAVVETALHLEVVTTDCSDTNVKTIVIVLMRWVVVVTHGLDEERTRMRVTRPAPVVTTIRHQASQVKMIFALDHNHASQNAGDGTW